MATTMNASIFMLVLLLTLSLPPMVIAANFSWTHVIQDDDNHVVKAVLTTLPLAVLARAISSYRARGNSDPPLPEPQDERFVDYLRSFLASEWLLAEFRLKNTETLDEAVTRLLKEENYLVPESQSPSRIHRQGALQRVLLSLESLFASQKELLEKAKDADAAEQRENQVTLQVAQLGDQCTKWERATALLNRGNTISPEMAQQFIQQLQNYSNLDPFRALIKPSLLKPTLDPTNLADQISTVLRNEFETIWNAIPLRFRGSSVLTSTDQLPSVIQNMANAVNRMTQHMSGIVQTSDPAPQGCVHPEELARELGLPPNTPWADLLREVSILISGPTPKTSSASGLFRASDVPEFADRSAYWSYRSSLRRFFSSVSVSQENVLMALNRILSRFTGNNADAANRWDISQFFAGKNWTQASAAFLTELDKLFLSPEFFRNQIVELRKLHPRPAQGAQDFILDFTTQVRTLKEAASIAGTTALSDQDVIRQLLAVLPSHVRNAVYLQYDLPENIDPDTLFAKIIRIWINTPAPYKPPAAPSRASLPGGTNQGTTRNLRYGSCNKPCWETTPAIPLTLRGPARGRDKQKPINRPELDNLCWSCRRSPTEHNGTAFGCPSPGPHGPQHGTTNRITDPSRLITSGNE